MLTPRSRITSGGIRGAQAMCQHGWMDGWMGGWMDGWLDEFWHIFACAPFGS